MAFEESSGRETDLAFAIWRHSPGVGSSETMFPSSIEVGPKGGQQHLFSESAPTAAY